jgi:Na+/melibiose symporter-like transporter
LLQQVGAFLLCVPPVHGGIAVAGWYTLFFIVFNIGNSACSGPFDAMMIESTRDDDDYRIFTTVVFPICGLIGGGSGILVTLISPIMAAVISFTVNLISTLLLVYRVETPVIRVTARNPDLIPSVRIAARTHEFKSIFLYKVLINSAITIFLACYAYYLLIGFDIKDIKKYVQLLIVIAYAAAGVGICTTIACNWLLRFVDKVQFLQTLLLMGAVFTFVSIFVILPSSSSLTGYVVVCVLVAMLGFPGRLVETLILRDLVVYDTFTTGIVL